MCHKGRGPPAAARVPGTRPPGTRPGPSAAARAPARSARVSARSARVSARSARVSAQSGNESARVSARSGNESVRSSYSSFRCLKVRHFYVCASSASNEAQVRHQKEGSHIPHPFLLWSGITLWRTT